MLKIFYICLLIISSSYASDIKNYLVTAKKGDIIVNIQGANKSIKENKFETLYQGFTIKLINGKGEALITDGNSVIKTLNKFNSTFKIPSKGVFNSLIDFTINKVSAYNNPQETTRPGVTKGLAGESNTIIFDINTNYDTEYYSFHSDLLTPTPAKFTLFDKNNKEIISYIFTKNDFDTSNKKLENEVFFTIPTKILKQGQTFNIVCGRTNRKQYERVKGKINILPLTK